MNEFIGHLFARPLAMTDFQLLFFFNNKNRRDNDTIVNDEGHLKPEASLI
jgi:hypothetical protein